MAMVKIIQNTTRQRIVFSQTFVLLVCDSGHQAVMTNDNFFKLHFALYFIVGQFPGDHGLVAPGMSCRYTIHFIPDSLGDYDDCLQVYTQASTPMNVQLQGRRPPPVLTCK